MCTDDVGRRFKRAYVFSTSSVFGRLWNTRNPCQLWVGGVPRTLTEIWKFCPLSTWNVPYLLLLNGLSWHLFWTFLFQLWYSRDPSRINIVSEKLVLSKPHSFSIVSMLSKIFIKFSWNKLKNSTDKRLIKIYDCVDWLAIN